MNKILVAILFVTLSTLNISCESKSKNKKLNTQNEKSSTGKVIGIIDGDTYDILLNGNETSRIRMEGIDAPEKGMPFYRVSKTYLGNLCKDQNIRLVVTGKDSHDRTLAYSYLDDGRELSHEMIKAGLAWHFKRYNSDSVLSALEITARNDKVGLWVDDDPMPPWVNRELHYKGISTKDSFDIKVGQE